MPKEVHKWGPPNKGDSCRGTLVPSPIETGTTALDEKTLISATCSNKPGSAAKSRTNSGRLGLGNFPASRLFRCLDEPSNQLPMILSWGQHVIGELEYLRHRCSRSTVLFRPNVHVMRHIEKKVFFFIRLKSKEKISATSA